MSAASRRFRCAARPQAGQRTDRDRAWRSGPSRTLDDLAGKQVYVRKATSYYESLTALNERFKKSRQAGHAESELLPDALEDEDALEMLNAGMLRIVVVDDWKAKMWAQVLPRIKVREDLVGTQRRLCRLGDHGRKARNCRLR